MPPQKCILANAAGAGRALHAGVVVKSLVERGQGYVNSHTSPPRQHLQPNSALVTSLQSCRGWELL